MKPTTLQPDRAGTLGELLRVSLPLVISYGSTAMMYAIDRMFLSWYSVDAMAAALPAGVMHNKVGILAIGTVAFSNALIGQYDGAGLKGRVVPVVWQGLYLSLFGAAAIALLVPFAPQMFALFGHASAVQEQELRFFTILSWGT